MKRKLDDNDAPTVEVEPTQAITAPTATFESFGLDARLLQAIASQQYAEPTPVQKEAIYHALNGKDVLAQSKTGSGKTAAYILPLLQSVLRRKAAAPNTKSISALVLVPTRELAEQVHKSILTFTAFCSKEIRAANLTQRVSDAVLNAVIADSPDIVVSTPGRVNQLMTAGSFSLLDISQLVLDEADLVLSYGYDNDIKTIAKAIPRGSQSFLMSATMTTDVEKLEKIFCRDPVVVKIEEKEEERQEVSQYAVKCGEDEKFLLVYVIFKLRLVRGKCIIFVADLDRSYRVRLYLEQFGIKSCVLNPELPINSRLHVVREFNKGLYDILIASDDQEVFGGIAKVAKAPTSDESGSEQSAEESAEEEAQPAKRKKKSRALDYGVSRGIDFQNVACVLNFDLPRTSKSYTHRIGRTARAGKSGMVLSFIVPANLYRKHKPTSIKACKSDEKVLARITARQAKKDREIKDYKFDMGQVDAFRYRMNDALRAVTGVAVREARSREIKQELIKSEKLRKHFDENPDDLKHLRHDGESGKARTQPHLKHVPEYLMPAGKRPAPVADTGFVSLNKYKRGEQKKKAFKIVKGRGRRSDPLKSFNKRK